MSNNGNWFAVSRMIFDHQLVGIHDRPFTELEAWLWLIAEAEFEPRSVSNKGNMIVLDPGQMMAAHSFLATRWEWTVDKVRWFLKRLQNEAMIARYCETKKSVLNDDQHTKQNPNRNTKPNTKPNTNQIQILTICNYSQYQYTNEAQHQAKPQPEHQAQHQALPQELNTKHLLTKVSILELPLSETDVSDGTVKSKKVADYSAEFEQFWTAYPDRTNNSKAKAFGEWLKLSRADRGLATGSLSAFAAYCKGHPDYRCVHAERYLRDRRFEGYAAGETATGAHWWQDSEKVACVTDDQWRNSIRKSANGTWPIDKLSPPPGTPGCRVPEHIVDELRLKEIYDANGVKRSGGH